MADTNHIPKVTMAGAALAFAQSIAEPAAAPVLRVAYSLAEAPAGSLWNIPKALRWGGVWGVSLSLSGDSSPKPVSPVLEGEPNMDDLRRLLEDAGRDLRELQKQSPAWYSNPFSPDVTGHQAKLKELSLWTERLKLEIDLKEWEEARDIAAQQNPYTPPTLEDKEIERLRQAISEVSTRSEREQGLLSRIVASAASGSDATSHDSPVERDWETLAAAGDNLAFAKAEDDFIQEANQAIVVRIDRGDSAATLVEWFKHSVSPQVSRISAAVDTLQRTDDEKQIFHDIRNRLTVLKVTTPLFLESGKIDVVRSLSRPPDGNLTSIIRYLKSRFALTASITTDGLDHLRLSSKTDLTMFMAMMVNLVGNAAEHPAPGKKVTPITIKYYQGMIIIDDKGAGMSDDALDNLRNGVRIHDGKVVDAADVGGEHGYGSKIVQEMCDVLGIDKDIDSEVGRGTTVVLALPDEMIEPDVMDVIIRSGNNDDVLKEVVGSLSPERRLELVGEMSAVAQKVFDQRIEQVFDILITEKSVEGMQRQFREIGDRYRHLLDMVIDGLSPTNPTVSTAIWNSEVLRNFLQPTPEVPCR